jgi:hypothetical protein
MIDAEPAALNQLERVAEQKGGTCQFSEADAEVLKKTVIPAARFFIGLGHFGPPLLKLCGWIAGGMAFWIMVSDWWYRK